MTHDIPDPSKDPMAFKLAWKELDRDAQTGYVFPQNLDYCDLSNLSFMDVDLSGRSLYGANFTSSNIVNTNFADSDLRAACFDKAAYNKQTNFSGAETDEGFLKTAEKYDMLSGKDEKQVYKPCMRCGHSKTSHQDYLDVPMPCCTQGCSCPRWVMNPETADQYDIAYTQDRRTRLY